MDERLEAGRHHLLNGDKALHDGYLDDSRSHFEAALLQFRGPELRLGEAHALRGLARVELGSGHLYRAEETARASIRQYQEVRVILERVDTEGVSRELWRDAEEGEAAALIVLAEVLMRSNRKRDAHHSLEAARDLFDSLGDVPSAAGVWMALGRLLLRDDRLSSAGETFDRAISLHQRSGDRSGECHGWLALAEVRRLEGRYEQAEEGLQRAVVLARSSHDGTLLGRALSHMGSLLSQVRRNAEARGAYAEALPLIREAGDVEMEGFARVGLGDVSSRQGDADAVQQLVEGARLLASLDNQHGLGTAMCRLAEHALRVDAPGIALAAAESARQLWYNLDPVRGVGQALRQEVKALAALRRWPAVVTVAHHRAAVAGDVQPNATEVRDFYRARSPQKMLAQIDRLSAEELENHAEAMIAQALESILQPLDLDALVLGSVGGALAVVEALVELGPVQPAAAPSAASEGEDEVGEDLMELPDDAVEALDQVELESPAAHPKGEEAERSGEEAERSDSRPEVGPLDPPAPAVPPPAAPSEAQEPAGTGEAPSGYEGLYEAPAVQEEDEEDEEEEDEEEEEVSEEEDAEVEALRREPAPDGYASLYDPPSDD